MNRTALFASALLAATLGGHVHAQKAVPGLWEYSIGTTGGGEIAAAMAQMQQELAKMPPEQRKQMEQMMGQQGIGLTPTGTTVRLCITPEQAARDEMPQQDGRCTQQSVKRTGNVLRFKFACSGDPPTSGEGEYTFTSDKAYSGRMTIDTVAKGKPQRMQMTQTGRWLSADCGNLAPVRR